MMDSHNSRLEHPRRRVLTSESQGRSSDLQRMHTGKCTEPLRKGDQAVAFISYTCLARSSNAFQLPEMAQGPQAKDSKIFKCRAAKALFSKNRKRMETNQNEKRGSISNIKCSLLPNGFSRILKAKSTVMRQNKLQEFYISLGDEVQPHNFVRLQSQNMKSNFFKPNFAKKKTKMKRQSLYIEKSVKPGEDCLFERANVGTKVDTYQSKTNQSDFGVLKERVVVNNRQKAAQPKRLRRNIGEMQRDHHKSKPEEKQNMEFNLEPWDNPIDDPFF